MKLNLLITLNAFVLCSSIVAHGYQAREQQDAGSGEAAARILCEPNVVIEICAASGEVTVRGWDRMEASATSEGSSRVVFRRLESRGTAGAASRLEVYTTDQEEAKENGRHNCIANADLNINVPRSAIIHVAARAADVRASDVSEAHVNSLSGAIELSRISAEAEAASVSGDITIKQSQGRVRLRSISGEIDAANLQSEHTSDEFVAKSVSGELKMENVRQPRVEATTVNGDVLVDGDLVKGGRYDFKSTSGSVTFVIPAASSFQLNAVLAQAAEVAADSFNFKETTSTSAPFCHRVTGMYGAGDATVNVSLFSGTLFFKRK